MDPVIGIDLGTTNSAVAAVEGNLPTIIANKGGYRLTPSVVAVAKNGKRLVGQLARRQAETNPENTISGSKRFIGRTFPSPVVQQGKQRVSYELVEGPHEDVRVRLAGEVVSLPEVAAMILSELRMSAEKHLGCAVQKAVITVPAYFNDNQRQATQDAGRIAGLDVLRIINEPTAAAIAHGKTDSSERRVVVFDLGGGTFDVSVMEISDGVFDVIATGGDTYLGGEDFDDRVIDWATRRFEAAHGVNLLTDKMALQRLRAASEQARIELSSATVTELSLPFVATGPQGPLHLQEELSREQLEDLCRDLVERCMEICAGVLHDANLSPRAVDEVLLVGGMSRMPLVADSCRKFFGKEPARQVHPEEVVALGAAVQAHALVQHASDMLLLDVTPHSLGIWIAGGLFSVLIPRNTTVPTSARHVFTTTRDEQTNAKIMVLQGDSSKASENELLGEFLLSGLPARPRGQVEIEVVFEISADGLVSVSARDMQTGQRQSITVTASSGLDAFEIEAMFQKNQDYVLALREEETTGQELRRVAALLKELETLHQRISSAPVDSASLSAMLQSSQQAISTGQRVLADPDVPGLATAAEAIQRSLLLLRSFEQEAP